MTLCLSGIRRGSRKGYVLCWCKILATTLIQQWIYQLGKKNLRDSTMPLQRRRNLRRLFRSLEFCWSDDAGGRLEISFFQLLVLAWMGLWLCPRQRTGAGRAVGSCAVTAAGGCRCARLLWVGLVLREASHSCVQRTRSGSTETSTWASPSTGTEPPWHWTSTFPCGYLCLLLQFFSGAEWCSFPASWRSDCCMVPLMTLKILAWLDKRGVIARSLVFKLEEQVVVLLLLAPKSEGKEDSR